VLDAGATESGRPYFVMELVRGIPITDYCDRAKLSITDRLGLFVQVCQAVQHAHQKGIIHRDLKPSNVLVTLIDGAAVPKIIDFGVAKAIGQQLTEKTLFTGFAQLIGTPLYMSPEQATLSGVDIDTRSDIYSLGVLLYELLTGTTPFDAATFRTAGYDEMRRIIREQEPPKPSTRLSTTEALPSIAANRSLEPRRLIGLMHGELDWIVMKCLEKDRDRRYETANALARDLRRYLEDEPVEAGPPSAWYRLRKAVRRNRAALAVAVGLFLALTAVASSIGWAVRDRSARKAALETEARGALREAKDYRDQDDLLRATAAARRAAALLKSGGSAEIQRQVQKVLAELQFLEDVEESRLKMAELLNISEAEVLLAGAFRNYGLPVLDLEPEEAAERIAGSAIAKQLVSGLDDWAWCAWHRADRDRLWAVARAADHDPVRQQIREAEAHEDHRGLRRLAQEPTVLDGPVTVWFLLGRSLYKHGVPEAVDLLRRAQQRHPADVWINYLLALSLAQSKPPRLEEAVGFFRAALALRPQSPFLHLNLGRALQNQGKLAEAEAAFREAIRLKPDEATAYDALGGFLCDLKRDYAGAVIAFGEALRLKPDHFAYHYDLGNALLGQRKLGEAEAAFREALRLKKDYPKAHTNLGNALLAKGQPDEAIAEYRQAVGSNQDFPEAYIAHYGLGNALKAKRRLDEAIAEYREAIRLKPDHVESHNDLGALLCDYKHDYAGALSAFREAIHLKPDHAGFHFNLGNAHQGQGKFGEAEDAYREALRLKPDYAEARLMLGVALEKQRKTADALAVYREGIRRKPDVAAFHDGLAWALATCGDLTFRDPQQAVASAKRAVQLAPQDGNSWGTLGVAYYRTRDWKNAIMALEKTEELAPGRYVAHDGFFLAMAHWQLGEKQMAGQWYENAVEWMEKNDPENEELRRFRTEAEALLRVMEKKNEPPRH
jgi:tetratricopeptide (TPR) repeat protein